MTRQATTTPISDADLARLEAEASSSEEEQAFISGDDPAMLLTIDEWRSLRERLRLAEAVVREVQVFEDDDGDGTSDIWEGINNTMAAYRAALGGSK